VGARVAELWRFRVTQTLLKRWDVIGNEFDPGASPRLLRIRRIIDELDAERTAGGRDEHYRMFQAKVEFAH